MTPSTETTMENSSIGGCTLEISQSSNEKEKESMNQLQDNWQLPFNPESYPSWPPPIGPFASPPPSSKPKKPYNNATLLLLSIIYGLFWLLCFIGSTASPFLVRLGISLFAGVLTSLLIMDWHGTVTLQGVIQWSKRKWRARIVLGLLWFVFSPLLIGLYLLRAFHASGRRANPTPVRPMHSHRPQVGLVVGSLVTLGFLLFASVVSTASTARPNTVVTTIATPTSTRTRIVQIAHATPTHIVSQATPAPKHFPTPLLTQGQQGVPANPWGFDFHPGNLIYWSPSDFCTYFACTSNFWNGNGYVNECRDGNYSMFGGIPGNCLHHGGEWRTLYSHGWVPFG